MTRYKPAFLLLLVAVFACIGASPASSQSGVVMLFGDASAVDCNITDTGGLVQVYIWYILSPGTRGVRFRLNVDGLGWTFIADSSPYPRSGTTVEGVIICWDDCRSGSFQLATANFVGSSAPACSYVTVDAYPDAGVEALDCDFNVINPGAGVAVVNPDARCPCNACLTGAESACARLVAPESATASNFCATVPVEQSTWGAIKSLYER